MRILLSTVLFSAVCFYAAAENTAQSYSVNLDGIEVTAIADVSGRTMGIELFEGGTLTKEQKLAIMPNGQAPSSVNVFVIKTAGKTYLIDAGYGNAIKDKRIDASKIDAVLITHAHGDHISGLLKEDGTAVFSAPLFISQKESDYWLNGKTPNSDLPKNVAKVYGKQYKTFYFGDTVAPGITAIDAVGHTPGHTAFLIGTGKNKMLIAADFLHAAALQFPYPEYSASFDVDKKKAEETRRKLMKTAEDNGWLIAGMHIPLPAFGKVKSNGKGGFEFLTGK